MGLVLYDDLLARRFEPFALTRPAGELRAGGELIRRRWARRLDLTPEGFIGAPHLATFTEFDAPPAVTDVVRAGTIVVNSRCAVAIREPDRRERAAALWNCDGRLAAIRLAADVPASAFDDGTVTLDSLPAATGTSVDIDGWWLDAPWDLIRHLNAMLAVDAIALAAPEAAKPAGLTLLGTYPVRVDPKATIEPFVVADATAGPILVRRGAVVQSFTRLVGPCIIGEDATVSGGRIAASSIGERVKVNGEVSSTIFIGHANKGHDGFVGHSVIGRWANLGAGTITSNLKNSYGQVQLWTPLGMRDTGLTFLGAMLGDHVKTGIGTRLTTGCVVGAGANLFGSTMPPKVVAPFAWGEAPAWETFAFDKFVEVATRVMARREVALTPEMREHLAAAHAARWPA
jgi:UDP-N-acetylglucosamine diphosphorylase/glucosamine-1-phosphate N-acetyltransferase